MIDPVPDVPGEWANRAACRGWPTSWWFPSGAVGISRTETNIDTVTALRICRDLCPVRAECLIYALQHLERGIWGGVIEGTRLEMAGRVKRRKRVA